ncbi:MAG: DUF4296 domain-containing protein [Bacteroidaceae bacterium]|nr:DUF4296 domain-containing protein [Bacteroidaceae bacterium]
MKTHSNSPLKGENQIHKASSIRGGLVGSFILLFLILQACSPSLPSGILDEEEMEDVLVDFHLAQGMVEAGAGSEEFDITRYKFLQAVFQKHHITEAEFDSSMVYYSGHAEDFAHIYDNVVNRVKVQAERMGLEEIVHDPFAFLTSEGDTANIWLGKDFACVVPNRVGCVYSFQMKADYTFRLGDSFIWCFKTQFVARSMNNEAVALLNLYYDTDTVVSVSELVRNSSKNELKHYPNKGLDTLGLRSISGFIYLPPSNSADPPKPLLVSEIKLIRMHKKEQEAKSQEFDSRSDSLAFDSLSLDTMPQKTGERLTPFQMRESQPRERKIRVVKENPNPIHPDRGIPQRTNRRRK